ncbi:MAG: hypothetical protein P8X42_09225 [Calditrichaceae bacterium]
MITEIDIKAELDNWEFKKQDNPTDREIAAYLIGLKKGREIGAKEQSDKNKALRSEKFKTNLVLAMKTTSSFVDLINKNGFQCKSARLKFEDFDSFTAIFVVSEHNYCDERFLNIYDKAIEKEHELNNSPTFNISFTFTPDNDYLNINSMVADGFKLAYGIHKA